MFTIAAFISCVFGILLAPLKWFCLILLSSVVGFTQYGIAAGSWAACLMSQAAIANGGGVASASIIASFQSFTMTAIWPSIFPIITGLGLYIAGIFAFVRKKTRN